MAHRTSIGAPIGNPRVSKVVVVLVHDHPSHGVIALAHGTPMGIGTPMDLSCVSNGLIVLVHGSANDLPSVYSTGPWVT